MIETANRRLKVLISAYACNPYKGSEEGVGWGWINAIAQFADPWVITASYHKHSIDQYLSENPNKLVNIRFVYVEHKPWHYCPTPYWKWIEGSVFKPIMNLVYMLWLKDAYKLAKKLHVRENFDLSHQLTYVGFRFPGRLWKLNIPFVWGPIGGLENTPTQFLRDLGLSGTIYYTGRNLINTLQLRMLRSPRMAFKAAGAGVIAATSGIQREIMRWYRVESHVICEVGPLDQTVDGILKRVSGEPLSIVWSGQHLPGKALPLLLRALVNFKNTDGWHLDILGDGPLRNSWEQEADTLGISKHCSWHGQVSRSEATKIMRASHLFVITSLKDLTSSVLLEAFGLGLPVICPDHCGFSDAVNDSCGIKVPLIKPDQFEDGLTEAIKRMEENEEVRQKMAHGALCRVKDFSWDKKSAAILSVYQKVL